MKTPCAGRIVLAVLAAFLVPACGTDTSTTVIQPVSGPKLASLALSTGNLDPAFAPDTSTYSVGLVFDPTIALTPTAADAGTTILVNGTPVPSGTSHAVSLTPGTNMITLTLFASNGTQGSYFLLVRRSVQEAYVKASNTEAGDSFGASTENLGPITADASSVAVSGDWMAVGAWSEDSGAAGVESDNSAANSGAVYLFRRVASTWSQRVYLKAPNIGAGDQFGRSVAIDSDTLAIGAPREENSTNSLSTDDNSASGSGAVYIYRYSGGAWVLEAYLKASTITAWDNFGAAVALQGNVLLVGAPGEDGAASNSGAAYVFRRTGTTWTQEALLKASNPKVTALFGSSVALDGGALVVGAWGENSGNAADPLDTSASFAGAAYIFRGGTSSWTQEAYLKAQAIDPSDRFGWSVAISGDIVAVGAPREDSGSTGINGDATNNLLGAAGAVYVFRRVAGAWAQEAYVKQGHTSIAGLEFGVSLALRNGTLIVGASAEDGNNAGINPDPNPQGGSFSDSGAIFLFRYLGAAWVQEAYLKAAVIDLDDQFGRAVAFDGQTLVVGAPREDSNAKGVNGDATNNTATESGAVYVFR